MLDIERIIGIADFLVESFQINAQNKKRII